MTIQNNDLLVLQQHNGGELRKASVGALLANVPSVSTPWERDGTNIKPVFNGDSVSITDGSGDPQITLNSDGSIDAISIDCGTY